MKKLVAIAFCLSVLLEAGGAHGIVSPSGWDNREGDAWSEVPFSTGSSVRYQQVYAPNAFMGRGADIFRIDRIDFRLNTPPSGPIFTHLTNIQINLSTTARGPDGLSTLFAENVGADDTMVFRSNSVLVQGLYDPASSPQGFGFFFALTTPFDYDITRGNLLMDIRIVGDRLLGYLDAVNRPGDDVSRMWSLSATSVSGTADSLGLVTHFRAEAIPEPGILTVFLCGLPFIGWIIHRQARRQRKELKHRELPVPILTGSALLRRREP